VVREQFFISQAPLRGIASAADERFQIGAWRRAVDVAEASDRLRQHPRPRAILWATSHGRRADSACATVRVLSGCAGDPAESLLSSDTPA
jgi:hypothetical protein